MKWHGWHDLAARLFGHTAAAPPHETHETAEGEKGDEAAVVSLPVVLAADPRSRDEHQSIKASVDALHAGQRNLAARTSEVEDTLARLTDTLEQVINQTPSEHGGQKGRR